MADMLTEIANELKSKLVYFHKGVRNITRPDKPHRVGDKIGFTVYVRNQSNVVVRNLSGLIQAAPAVKFNTILFVLPSLNPGADRLLAPEIKAEVVADTNDFWRFLDKVAIVTATGKGDLSAVAFQDTGTLVDIIQPA